MKKNGVSPSFDEMRDQLGLKSKSGIYRLLDGLEERGYIRRLNNRARAVEVVKLPENLDPQTLPIRNRRTDAEIRQAAMVGRKITQRNSASNVFMQLPLYGRIAAGTPIEALRDETILIEVPMAMLGRGDHYALEIEGDSMIEAGIMDGDTVVIERIERAETGDIVVALIDGEEATLKRYQYQEGEIILHPANRHYQINHYEVDRVRIQGRLVGLMRKY